MAFEISCPTCTSLGTELTIARAMKVALAHAPQHSPVYIAGDGARFTIRHDGKPAIEVQFDDARPDLHHLARKWDDPEPVPLPMSAREPSSPRRQPRGDEARYNSPSGSVA